MADIANTPIALSEDDVLEETATGSDILTPEESRAVVMAAIDGANGRAVSEDDLCLCIEWAERAVLAKGLLDLVLAGTMRISVTDGTLRYFAPGRTSDA